MATLGAAANKMFGFETARIPFDLTVEAEFFGARVDMGKQDRTPMVKEAPFTSESEVEIPKQLGGRCRSWSRRPGSLRRWSETNSPSSLVLLAL